MFLGYNTNGFAHHRLTDAITILAELGYKGVALTPDVHHLDPFAPDLPSRVADLARRLDRHRMGCVIETGARFLLDPRRKHQPTLLSPTGEARAARADFLRRCLNIASDLNTGYVSLWAGTPIDDAPHEVLMARLADQCRELCEYTSDQFGWCRPPLPRLAFEPEPGMFIDTMERFAALYTRVNHPAFGLTVDIGHLVCNGELPMSKVLTDWKHVLWNVHVEDMRRGVHDHLMFGEGEVDFADVFAGLRAAGYAGGVYVELSRHSHDAVNTARRAKQFLDRFVG